MLIALIIAPSNENHSLWIKSAFCLKLTENGLQKLKLNISPCSKCGEPRINESQKFCHNCGSALVDQSTFERCMALDLQEVTHLTIWQKERIKELKIKKIGDFLALQDPGTELRKLHRIGSKRAKLIIGGVDYYVDEFLS